jgi:hypothetical protein
MASWPRGEAEVEGLVHRRELERVTGAASDGAPLLAQARRTAATAAGLISTDPYSAYVLAYDAARFACVALLAQQGLRATSSGGWNTRTIRPTPPAKTRPDTPSRSRSS